MKDQNNPSRSVAFRIPSHLWGRIEDYRTKRNKEFERAAVPMNMTACCLFLITLGLQQAEKKTEKR